MIGPRGSRRAVPCARRRPPTPSRGRGHEAWGCAKRPPRMRGPGNREVQARLAGSAPVPRCVGFRSRWCVLLAGRGQLEVGERAPDFVLSRAGVTARFYAYAGGRPTAVVFDGDGDDLRLGDLADRLAGRDDVALCYVTFQEPAGGAGAPPAGSWNVT